MMSVEAHAIDTLPLGTLRETTGGGFVGPMCVITVLLKSFGSVKN